MLTDTTDGTARPRLDVGDWSADPATNELRRGDEKLRIEPKAMEVLMLLAERAGRVVSREELFTAVWPNVVVGDEALTQSIIKLRRALGDSAHSPSYIETISKRGYRLIAPVRRAEPAASVRDGIGDAGPQPPARKRHRMRVLGLVAVGVFAIAMASAYLIRSVAPPPDAGAVEVEAEAEDRPASLTVTVVPFESLGGDDEQSYLARGIGNDLMTDLSRVSNLLLITAGSAATADPAARRARYLVTGSVQRVSGILRINIRLVDTETNRQLWSERFERPFDDLFAVQDEITRKLSELLPGKLADAARQRVAKRYTRSLEAYDSFLRGQALLLARQADDNEEARALYRKAIALDPEFARAYAGLAMTYAMDYRLRRSAESFPALARAFDLAETARQIDPDLPQVHWALGFVHVQSRRHEQAIESLQRAIQLNRSFADAYALMGGIYTYIGQPEKSIPLLRMAMRLDADAGYLYFMNLGRAYLFENDIEQALFNLREALARNPVDLETRIYLAAAMAAAQDLPAARWEVQEIRSLDTAFSLPSWLDTYPLTSTPHRERLTGLLAKAGL